MEADRLFRSCLRDRHHSVHVWFLWLGVRLGGLAAVPTAWRWGYGWNWPHSKPPHPDRSAYSVESQRLTYEAIRRQAIEADQQAGGQT